MKRTPLTRTAWLRRGLSRLQRFVGVKPRRATPRRKAHPANPQLRAWVALQPCIVRNEQCTGRTDPHHVRTRGAGGPATGEGSMNDEQLLALLQRQATKSDCAKIKFGAAALTEQGEVLGVGCNHNPHPLPPAGWSCATDCVGGIRRGVASGTCVERCYALHAEQAALLDSLGRGVYEIAVAGTLPDGSLFDNGGGFYCTVCARLMVAMGVARISIWSGGKRQRLTMQQAWNQSYAIAAGVR